MSEVFDPSDLSSYVVPVEGAQPNQPSAEDLAAAKILATYIEFGTAPKPMPPIPEAWQPVFEDVGRAQGGRSVRWLAFLSSIKGTANHYKFLTAVDLSTPPRENRGTLGRKIWTAQDALGEPPPMDWLVEDLFVRPSLNILVGDAGSKKTLLALDLAVGLALGKPWLGRATSQCSTLIIDEETGRPRLWARVHDSLCGHGGDEKTPLYFMSLPGFDLRTETDIKILRRDIEDLSAGFVVIDALADVIRGGDENTVNSVTPMLNHLRLLAEECHIAILLIHHNNRTGAFRGSSHISAAVDLMLSIESPTQSTIVSLKPLKTRYASPRPFAAQAHFEPGRFHFTPNDLPAQPVAKLSSTSRAILDFLQANTTATTADLFAAIQQYSQGALRNSLHTLATSGHIVRIDGGGRGSVATFSLPQHGEHANP